MNAIFGAVNNGPAKDVNLAKNIWARTAKLPGAIARLVAGPPMSERERYHRNVAEVRGRTLEGLPSAWFRPR